MELEEFIAEWENDSEQLLVHTSGSTGAPKPLWVDKRRMEASARITCDFLGLREGDTALLCLPLDYIAGKMMVVRSKVRRLRLLSVEPSSHPLREVASHIDFAAMVPLQVWNTLQSNEERRRFAQIGNIIIGGGSIDEQLESELRCFSNAVWSTYGMTETLSHIALRRISGDAASEWYEPFPTVRVGSDADGCLVVDAPEVCSEVLHTNDIVVFADNAADDAPRAGRRFKVVGRRDNVICSGGVKIQGEEVERRLRPYISGPFVISKQSDAAYGEVVVLVAEETDEAKLRLAAEKALPQYSQPKRIIAGTKIVYTETGKPRRDISLYRHIR